MRAARLIAACAVLWIIGASPSVASEDPMQAPFFYEASDAEDAAHAELIRTAVFGVRDVGAQKAWPVAAFAAEPVINDTLAGRNLVLVGDAATGAVRAYERGERTFSLGTVSDVLVGDGEPWVITETALVGPDGTQLARVAGHIAYWFAWDSYYGVTSELYVPR